MLSHTETQEDRGLVVRVGSLEIEWPKAIGYFGGIWLAVAYDLVAPPIGLFIAAIPVLKLFKHPQQPWPVRFVSDALEGAAKPVGGDAESTIRLAVGTPEAVADRSAKNGLGDQKMRITGGPKRGTAAPSRRAHGRTHPVAVGTRRARA
jgi:hypothetical protein